MHFEDKDFLESSLQDTFGGLEPLTKEEYDYFMSLPDKDIFRDLIR